MSVLTIQRTDNMEEHEEERSPLLVARLIISVVLLAAGIILEHNDLSFYIYFYIAALILSGFEVILSAVKSTLKFSFFDEKQLMTIAAIGACCIGKVEESAAVMILYSVGEFLEDYITDKSKDTIRDLLSSAPSTAHTITDIENTHNITDVSPEDVEVGTLLIIKPGEKIPLDGIVIKGESTVDTSSLTGESLPMPCSPDTKVLSGMINQNGALIVKTSCLFEDTSMARIIKLVKESEENKAPAEKFITRFARVYTPIILILAVLVAVLPPLFFGEEWSDWIYRAMTLLVIACPCALVISVPLGYFCGIGKASKEGIIVKGGTHIDNLAKVDTIFMDKTGTLTDGVFHIIDIITTGDMSKDEMMAYAASAESFSTHPLAKSISASTDKRLKIDNAVDITGKGIRATIEGRDVIIGSDKLLHSEDIFHDHDLCNLKGTIIHVSVDRKHVGYIVLSDQPRKGIENIISRLKKLGIKKTVMLTGDNRVSAAYVAKSLGIDEVHSELMPEEKVSYVKESEKKGTKAAFVGDGINDAPVIAMTDVGIAMGGMGSATAIEASNIVIMSDHLAKLADIIKISRKTRRIVIENIVVSLTIKAVFVTLAVLGMANMWLAVFADVGVTILAILNSIRIFR